MGDLEAVANAIYVAMVQPDTIWWDDLTPEMQEPFLRAARRLSVTAPDRLREAAQAVVDAIDVLLAKPSPSALTYGDFVPLHMKADALRDALAEPAPAAPEDRDACGACVRHRHISGCHCYDTSHECDCPGPTPASRMMGVHEASEALGVHHHTLKRIGPSELPYFRVGSRGDRRYRASDVEAYAARREER